MIWNIADFMASRIMQIKAGDIIFYQTCFYSSEMFAVAIVDDVLLQNHNYCVIIHGPYSTTAINIVAVKFAIPQRFAPVEIMARFYRTKLCVLEQLFHIDYVNKFVAATQKRAATCIQGWMIDRLYAPPQGRMYLKLKAAFDADQKSTYIR